MNVVSNEGAGMKASRPKPIEVTFFGGAMDDRRLTLPPNHFDDGDILRFHENAYFMKGRHAYFLQAAD